MKESLFDFCNPDRFYQLGIIFAFQKEWSKSASCYQKEIKLLATSIDRL